HRYLWSALVDDRPTCTVSVASPSGVSTRVGVGFGGLAELVQGPQTGMDCMRKRFVVFLCGLPGLTVRGRLKRRRPIRLRNLANAAVEGSVWLRDSRRLPQATDSQLSFGAGSQSATWPEKNFVLVEYQSLCVLCRCGCRLQFFTILP